MTFSLPVSFFFSTFFLPLLRHRYQHLTILFLSASYDFFDCCLNHMTASYTSLSAYRHHVMLNTDYSVELSQDRFLLCDYFCGNIVDLIWARDILQTLTPSFKMPVPQCMYTTVVKSCWCQQHSFRKGF